MSDELLSTNTYVIPKKYICKGTNIYLQLMICLNY